MAARKKRANELTDADVAKLPLAARPEISLSYAQMVSMIIWTHKILALLQMTLKLVCLMRTGRMYRMILEQKRKMYLKF